MRDMGTDRVVGLRQDRPRCPTGFPLKSADVEFLVLRTLERGSVSGPFNSYFGAA
jgi:hypothetical protein